MLRRLSVVAMTIVLLAPASRAASISGAQADSVETAIQAKIAERHIPGLQVAIVRSNEIVFLKSYGVASLESKKAVTNTTLFRIASSTKPLTATAAMQLYEKGALDLDAPVQKYAPTFPKKKYEITPRELLSHTSGVRNYRRGEPERTDHFDHLTDALSIFADDSLDFEPGTKYSYTSFGYRRHPRQPRGRWRPWPPSPGRSDRPLHTDTAQIISCGLFGSQQTSARSLPWSERVANELEPVMRTWNPYDPPRWKLSEAPVVYHSD